MRFYNFRLRETRSSSILKEFARAAGLSESAEKDNLTAAESAEMAERDQRHAERTGPAIVMDYENPAAGPNAAGLAGRRNAAAPAAGPTASAECLATGHGMDAVPFGRSASGSAMGPSFNYGADAVPFGRSASGSAMGPSFNYGADAVPFGRSASGSAMGPAFLISRRADQHRELPRGLVRYG